MLYELTRIKQMRKKLDITQTELAKLADVSQSLIAKIEKGNIEPSYSIARKIFSILDEQISHKQEKLVAKNICSNILVSINYSDSIAKAIQLMKEHAISQMPVIKNNSIIGSISEETFINNYDKISNRKMAVEHIMDEPFPTILGDTSISLVKEILQSYTAVILMKSGKPVGIITKADLLKQL